ncbi:MFS transporter [Desulfovibrio sp. QI0430]
MTQTDTTSPVEEQKLREAKKATAAAAFGTFLEYYDFSVYGYCAARISKEFFPSDNPTVSLLSTLAVFGLAFIVRPLGGLFFGHIGDRYGRKFSLVATVVLIGVACTAIGCLPTYDQIGIAAPILLILCRILQGFSAGGEIGSAASYIREWAPAERRSLYLSFVPSVANLGKAGAAGLTGLAAYLFVGESASWAWRVPFLVAMPLMLGCLWMRLKIEDTPDFTNMKNEGKLSEAPIKELIGQYPASLCKLFMYSLVQNVGTYCGTVYVAIYMRTVLKMPATEVGFIVLIAVTCAALFIPVFGLITDRVGPVKTLVACYVCYIVLSYPCYSIMGKSFGMAIFALVTTMIPYALCQAGSYSMYPELLPPRVRSTGVSFGHSMGAVLGGATTPFLATWLISKFNDIMIPAYILIFVGALGLVNLLILKKADPAEGRRFR